MTEDDKDTLGINMVIQPQNKPASFLRNIFLKQHYNKLIKKFVL